MRRAILRRPKVCEPPPPPPTPRPEVDCVNGTAPTITLVEIALTCPGLECFNGIWTLPTALALPTFWIYSANAGHCGSINLDVSCIVGGITGHARLIDSRSQTLLTNTKSVFTYPHYLADIGTLTFNADPAHPGCAGTLTVLL